MQAGEWWKQRSTVLQWSLVLLHFMYVFFFGLDFIFIDNLIVTATPQHSEEWRSELSAMRVKASRRSSIWKHGSIALQVYNNNQTNKLKWLDSTTISIGERLTFFTYRTPPNYREWKKKTANPSIPAKEIHTSKYLLTNSLFFFQDIFFWLRQFHLNISSCCKSTSTFSLAKHNWYTFVIPPKTTDSQMV